MPVRATWHGEGVPRFEGLPLYSVDEHEQTVIDALRHNSRVGIVGHDASDVVVIERSQLNGLNNVRPAAAEAKQMFQTFQENPRLYGAFYKQSSDYIPFRPEVELNDIPHVNGHPVLREPFDSIDYMAAAFHNQPRQFWLLRPNQRLIHVQGQTRKFLVRTPTSTETQHVQNVLAKHDAVVERLGPGLASVKYGKPIYLDMHAQDQRLEAMAKPPEHHFNPNTDRETMINALQGDGQFEIHDKDGNRFLVRVKPSRHVEDLFLRVDIKPVGEDEATSVFGKVYNAVKNAHRF